MKCLEMSRIIDKGEWAPLGSFMGLEWKCGAVDEAGQNRGEEDEGQQQGVEFQFPEMLVANSY